MTEEEFLKALVEAENKSRAYDSSNQTELPKMEKETEMDNVSDMHELNSKSMLALVLIAKEDTDLIDLMIDAFRDFEKYHSAIIDLETYTTLHDYGNTDRDRYRTEYGELDATRSRCHEAVLQDVRT